jgi:hypothetical protein
VFIRDQFPQPDLPDFVSLEYSIARKIVWQELVISKPKGQQFFGHITGLKAAHTVEQGGRTYDCLQFIVQCCSEWHWAQLNNEWEKSECGRRPGFDVDAHVAKRNASEFTYGRELWFDITDVFDMAAAVADLKQVLASKSRSIVPFLVAVGRLPLSYQSSERWKTLV